MEGIRGTTHPLETPIILEGIFCNLPVSDVKNCRLVSRAWRKSGAVVLRSLTAVHFEDNSDKISYFLDVVENENSIFSESAFVNNYDFAYVGLDDTYFFEICGNSVKTLDLCNAGFEQDSVDNLRRVIFESCPNMTELTLQTMRLGRAKNHSKEPTVWVPPAFPQNKNLKKLQFLDYIELGDISFLEIFSHFPALEEIRAQTSSACIGRIFQSLETVRKHDQEQWNIKSITFDFRDLEEPPKKLLPFFEGNISLETLQVSGVEHPEQVGVIRKILRVHASSLRNLRVHGSMSVGLLDEHTLFKKLKDLDCDTLRSISLLRNFPNLRKLNLSSISTHEEFAEELFKDWVISSCTGLRLYSEPLRLVEFQRLLWKLPNLKSLAINHCDNDMFSVICKLLPNLTFLHIVGGSTVDDLGISGLDIEDVERVNREETEGRTEWRPITVPRPNLTSLKNLVWFKLDSNPTAGIGLGACAALCGVEQLPKLKHFKSKKLSLPMWSRLLSQFQWKNP